MAKNKTTQTDEDVFNFINTFANNEQKRDDSYKLLEIMEKASGFKPKMWGPTIIGFGNYHYKYLSGHEGDAPLVGFSPRKAAISLYIYSGMDEHAQLLKDFGKFKMGKACIYINKLADVSEEKMVLIIKQTIKFLKDRYGKN